MMAREDRRHARVFMRTDEIIDLKTAAARACRSERTVRAWCKKHRIARQTVPGAPLQISAVALEMVLHGDDEALELLRAGQRGHPMVREYFGHLGLIP